MLQELGRAYRVDLVVKRTCLLTAAGVSDSALAAPVMLLYLVEAKNALMARIESVPIRVASTSKEVAIEAFLPIPG